MEIQKIFGLLVPLVLVCFGLLLRNSKNEKYDFAVKYWRWLVALGTISFLLKLAAFFLD